MYGPVEARHHDGYLLRESGIIHILDADLTDYSGNKYVLYGDQGYPLLASLIVPYAAPQPNTPQQRFNCGMSKAREAIEWAFKDIIQSFSFLDYHKNLKIFLSPVGVYYVVGALLTNCRTAFRGNQTSKYFGLHPPSLHGYVTGIE